MSDPRWFHKLDREDQIDVMADYEIAHETPEARTKRVKEEERAKHEAARRRIAELRAGGA